MGESEKVLYMTFATEEGGTFKIALSNTLDDLTPASIKAAMDKIVDAKVFATSKGEVTNKVKAYFVTQTVEDLKID